MPPAQRPAWVEDSLFPFESRFMEIDGNTVHYVDEGRGPLLLMLHGNPTWSFVYREPIAALRARFRCVAPDYPGFGLSSARAGYGFRPEEHAQVLSAFIERLDLRRITAVLQDWGGPIGISAVEHAPERFAGLVLANTWAWPVNGDPHFEVFSRLMGGWAGRRLIERLNLFVNLMIPAGHRLRRPRRIEMEHYRRALPDPERRRASAVFPRAITRGGPFLAELERGLGALRELPALIVWADRDIAFREQERRRWEQLLPDHTTRVLHGAGHYLQSDAPRAFARAIEDWFADRAARQDRREGFAETPSATGAG